MDFGISGKTALVLGGDLGAIAPQTEAIAKRFGPIDILVNNTGGPTPSPVAGQPVKNWKRCFEEMALPVVAITDTALPAMCQGKWGITPPSYSGVIASDSVARIPMGRSAGSTAA